MSRLNYFLGLVLLVGIFSCSSEESKTPKKMVAKRTTKVEPKEKAHPGEIIYMQFCIACHMQGGEGVPSLYPPLTQTEYVLGDKKKLIEAVIYGMEGPIEVKGEKYNNIMAKLDYLRDEQIAEVLSYVRSNFGNKAETITVDEVRSVRASGAKSK